MADGINKEKESFEDCRDDYREQQRLEDKEEIQNDLLDEVAIISPEEVKKTYKEYNKISKLQDILFPGCRRT